MSMNDSNQSKLYEAVRRRICRGIFEDEFREGDFLPPERRLSEELGVSRVTVRKALDLLEEEKIIRRYQGRGTQVSLCCGPRNRDMDIITVVAPAQNAFFSRFMGAFQTEAEKRDSLVLYKQKPRDMNLAACLYRIFEKGIRNVVLWLEDMEIREPELRKLAGLGMNLVLFDSPVKTPWADSVCVDNRDAIGRLYAHLREEGCRKIGYVGWDRPVVSNIRLREEYFRELAPEGVICRVPRHLADSSPALPREIAESIRARLEECDGLLYSVGDLSVTLERHFQAEGTVRKTAAMDWFPEADELGTASLEQDFGAMTEHILRCLGEHNREDSTAEPDVFLIRGKARW